VVPGIVFIDDVHTLGIECFTYLNTLLEPPMAPTVILAMNRGQSLVLRNIGYRFSLRYTGAFSRSVCAAFLCYYCSIRLILP
jgi:DNA helicase TIP49 (TBP-interacting protein)